MNIEKEKDSTGYIHLRDLNFKKSDRDAPGSRVKFWFEYEGEEYLYKKNSYEFENYIEIIVQKMAYWIKMKSAKYALCKYKPRKDGLITLDFIKDGEREISPQKLFDSADLKPYNDLCSIRNMLIANGVAEKERLDILRNLFRLYVFDLFISQRDRNITNWSVIYSGSYSLSPTFDSQSAFLLFRETSFAKSLLSDTDQFNEYMDMCLNDTTKFTITPNEICSTQMEELNLIANHQNIIRQLDIPEEIKKILSDKKVIEDVYNIHLRDIFSDLKKEGLQIPNIYEQWITRVFDFNKSKVEEQQNVKIIA